jgi:hypothetical protein
LTGERINGKLCRECYRARKRRWYAENPEKARAAVRRPYYRRYGITEEDFDRMFAQQEGRCGLCGASGPKRLQVDHNHSTGEIRKLLCWRCNIRVGHIEKDREMTFAVLEYLGWRNG